MFFITISFKLEADLIKLLIYSLFLENFIKISQLFDPNYTAQVSDPFSGTNNQMI